MAMSQPAMALSSCSWVSGRPLVVVAVTVTTCRPDRPQCLAGAWVPGLPGP
jgi:hypothetical protein